MRIKLDENLPQELVADLSKLGHDVDTAISEGLAGHDDIEVWAGAQDARRLLVTQDLDFSDVRFFVPGSHHGLVLLRLRDPSRSRLRDRLLQVFLNEAVDTWDRCLVVVGNQKFAFVVRSDLLVISQLIEEKRQHKAAARRRYRRQFRKITERLTNNPNSWESEVFHLDSLTSWDIW